MGFFGRMKATRTLGNLASHPTTGPLLDAAEAQVYIDKGADINAPMPEGYSILAHACVWGNLAVATILLGAGANPNAYRPQDMSPLLIAAGNGHEDIVKLLLRNGAAINAADPWGRTALHQALISGTGRQSRVPEILVEHGINAHAQDRYGNTALQAFALQVATLGTLPPMGNVTQEMRDDENRTFDTQMSRFRNLLN